jgi:hypothetical protein
MPSQPIMSLVLSVAGVLFLFLCLLLIALNRVPSLRSPQVIKALGVELDVSIITVLVLVGFTLAVSSIYVQIKNYEGQIAGMQSRLQALDSQLRHSGRVAFTPFVVLDGVSAPEKMPRVSDVVCTYVLVDGGNTLYGNATVSTGVSPTSLQIALLDIPLSADIRHIEIAEKQTTTPRTWLIENVGYPLSPSLTLAMHEAH